MSRVQSAEKKSIDLMSDAAPPALILIKLADWASH